MIFTVQDFCGYVSRNKVDKLAKLVFGDTGRSIGPHERESYTEVSKMLKKAMTINPDLSKCHVAVDTSMLLEYKLPAASAWCDLVILGQNDTGRYQVLIVELKNWQKDDGDTPGAVEGLMIRHGEDRSHPSQQVKGYAEYCRRFHSTVQDSNAECSGVVYITQPLNLEPYNIAPNDRLAEEYPIFNTDTVDALALHVANKVTRSNPRFAKMFAEGFYKQDRNILRQVAETISNRSRTDVPSPFQLLREQQLGFDVVMASLSQRAEDGKKQVIVVEGPPGSGKSAVAINIWAAAALKYTSNRKGNCIFVTTSACQGDNWTAVFRKYGGPAAQGLILKGTSYGPGITSTNYNNLVPLMEKAPNRDEMLHLEKGQWKVTTSAYEAVSKFLVGLGTLKNVEDNQHLLSVVDEAHALINPLSPDYAGFNQGWAPFRGPQAYHIIRQSIVSVFFTDTNQSFRDYESTSTEDIERFARELGADFKKVSLAGMQFRCSGSIDYVAWVDHLFDEEPLKNHDKWKEQYSVRLFDYPSDVETYLREKKDTSVRWMSSYTRPWASKAKVSRVHRANAPFDFDLEDKDGTRFQKYWNSEYDAYIQGAERTTMADDPLSEVGCPYVVRGFDYSWVGLLWLKDMIYREELGGWCIATKYVEETAISSIKGKALKEFAKLPKATRDRYTFEGKPLLSRTMDNCPAIQRLFKAMTQAYRILMTRALRGIAIYIEDEETRNYVNSLLKD